MGLTTTFSVPASVVRTYENRPSGSQVGVTVPLGVALTFAARAGFDAVDAVEQLDDFAHAAIEHVRNDAHERESSPSGAFSATRTRVF